MSGDEGLPAGGRRRKSPAAAPPLDNDDLLSDILLRLPPSPSSLPRASLVCKRWRRLVSGPVFRRRFRDLHRTPPMLGFLCNLVGDASKACFVPESASFRSPGADLFQCVALDARHGRVLLQRTGSEDTLVVWDPISDEKLELSTPVPRRCVYSWTAAVLCAAGGTCDHLDCHRGPFLLVYVGSSVYGKVFICTYSSDAGAWSDPIIKEQPLDSVGLMASVLVGNALYFGLPIRKSLLKYDLESHEMSVIGVPHTLSILWQHIVLDGELALATVHESKLCIWRKIGHEKDAGWTQKMAVELETLLPRDAILASPNVVGFANGMDVILLWAGRVLFTVDLKTYQTKKVCNGKDIYSAIPYMSFYTPALGAACTDEGSSVCASGA